MNFLKENMKIRIDLSAKRLGTSPDVFKRIISEFSKIEKNKSELTEFIIDIHEIKEVSLPALTLLKILAKKYKEIPCKKWFLRAHKTKEPKVFDESHFFEDLTGKKDEFGNESFLIHFESITREMANEQATELFEKTTKKFLDKDNDLHKEIAIHIQEIFENAFIHSNSKEESKCLCRKRGKIFEICVCDQGQGMKNSFLQNLKIAEIYRKMCNAEIIDEATKLGSTCNPENARNPKYKNIKNSGMGLYYARKFIEFHKNSRLLIFSGDGLLFVENGGKMKKLSIKNTPWNGTLVFFQTDLSQEISKKYKEILTPFEENDEISYL